MHLNNAPIVEALIDLRVRPQPGTQPSKLEAIGARIKDRYPTVKPIHQVATHVELKAGADAVQSVSQQQLGFRFESSDAKSVLQAQTLGFTLSRLAPYETWEALIQEAQAMWPHYVAVAEPESIERVATRYINRIHLPLPIGDFDEYLTAPPLVPKGLPDYVSEFFSRMVINDPHSQAVIIFTQAFEPLGPGNTALPVIVDIDVFKATSLPADGTDHWKLLTEFRDIKNTAFFASLTPKTVELLK